MCKTIKFYCLIVAVFVATTVIILGLVKGASSYEASIMRDLGYEAKETGLSCYAKFNGRWASCEAVLQNQVEIVGEAKK